MKLQFTRQIGVCLAYAILHLSLHFLAIWFETSTDVAISIWYPPSGLALSLLVLLGMRYWPVVFVVNFVGALFSGATHPIAAMVFPALITVNYALTAALVRRFVGSNLMPGDWRSTVVFVMAVVVSPAVYAGVGTVVASGHDPLAVWDFGIVVFNWWIGDASGILTVVPVAMIFVRPWLRGETPAIVLGEWKAADFAAALGRAVILVGSVVVVLAVPVFRDHYAFYLCFLPLVWICMKHGLPGAVLATLLITMTGLVGMRLTGSAPDFAYVYLLFEVAVAGVGLGLGALVSRRDEVERRLEASQRQLDRVIDGAQLGVWEWTIATGEVERNTRLSELLGYDAHELEGSREHWRSLIHPVDAGMEIIALGNHLNGRTELFDIDFRVRAKNGRWHWLNSRGSIVQRDRQGEPLRVAGTHVDINARKRAEAEILRLTKIIEATPDYVFTANEAGVILYVNAALLSAWPEPEPEQSWVGRSVTELFPEGPGQRLLEEAILKARELGSWEGEMDLESARGVTVPTSQVVIAHYDEENDTYTYSCILRDITEQRKAEAGRMQQERKLLEVQKAESLGVLAGGIAHDFNNLMTAVVGNANLARAEAEKEGRLEGFLSEIEDAAERASVLCHQMLAYAGRNPVSFTELDLNQLLEGTLQLLRPSISKKIAVEFEADEQLPPILASTTQAQQLVMNIAANGVQAMGDAPGQLTFRTSSVSLNQAEVDKQFPEQGLREGDFVVLEIEDTGLGMSLEVQSKIYEPFFTTKFTGQGLGLAAVVGYVKSHRGGISVRSEVGEGALFRVAFPALEIRPATKEIVTEPDENWQGSGTILVVDDDRSIRIVAGAILNRLGFSVRFASDGLDGVEKFKQWDGEIACVLLDLTMPRMDGFEAHSEMHRHNPNVPVLLISGYSQKLANLPADAIHPAGVLSKPFGIASLRKRLASILGPSAES
jgi:PAS domain S-box-containing protein